MRLREHGLAGAGHVLDQEVAATEQRDEREADFVMLADDDAFDIRDDAFAGFPGSSSLAVALAAAFPRRATPRVTEADGRAGPQVLPDSTSETCAGFAAAPVNLHVQTPAGRRVFGGSQSPGITSSGSARSCAPWQRRCARSQSIPGRADSLHARRFAGRQSTTCRTAAASSSASCRSVSTARIARSSTPSSGPRRRATTSSSSVTRTSAKWSPSGRTSRPRSTVGSLVVATVRRPGTSIYDRIGLQDFTTDDVAHERGINLLHGYLSEYYVEDATYIVPAAGGPRRRRRSPRAGDRPPEGPPPGLRDPAPAARLGTPARPRHRGRHDRPADDDGAAAARPRGRRVLAPARAVPQQRRRGGAGRVLRTRRSDHTLADVARDHGPIDLALRGDRLQPARVRGGGGVAKNGVLVLASVTGGSRMIEIDANRFNQGFVLGNKVLVGTVNASRRDFEAGVDRPRPGAGALAGLARPTAHDARRRPRRPEGDARAPRRGRRRDQGLRRDREAPRSGGRLMERLEAEPDEASTTARSRPHRPRPGTPPPARRARGPRDWYRWGPYLAERQWGTVREDYSADGDAWASLPHDHARSRAYRWGEDGLLGISDDQGRLCFALALWNERRPDPQGAPVRPHRPRGQPRRGRQGGLLLPRHHADPLLHAGALPYPQRAFPYARPGRRERAPRTATSRSTSCSTPASSTTTATSTSTSSTPRPTPRTSLIRDHGHQSRPRRGAAPPPADALVPQHLVMGLRRAARPDA